MFDNERAIRAQADLHHAYFLGLQLMVSTREGAEVVGEWLFRLFRRQHEEKFLPSFDKLGLRGLPDAVACARYHVLSNSMGGVPVEYMEESDIKAWVRFRYPRWMFDGPTLCGVPVEASRGFLRGWYAHNGVSLENPCLGFVCVSEDMTGEFGFCGYFKEFDHVLSEDERLSFAQGELPPPFDATAQPQPPAEEWSEERLAKAKRNYAVEFVRNGIRELVGVLGRERALELGRLAARLTGLQYLRQMADAVGAKDGDAGDAARFLAAMFQGMGDEVSVVVDEGGRHASLTQRGLRVARGLSGADRADLIECWAELWRGTVDSYRRLKTVEATACPDRIEWVIEDRH